MEAYKLSHEESIARATERSPEYQEKILNCRPCDLSWHDLTALYHCDPGLALRRWEEVQQAAREERQSGHRAARAGCNNSCWERAQFLAVRAELTDAWRPRDAQEQHLVDQLAQWQMLMERWQDTLTDYTMVVWGGPKRAGKKTDLDTESPGVSGYEAMETAVGMVERFHKLYLRTLRALQDQRRASPRVVVRQAGQVNVAAQQINVCGRK